MQVILRLMTSVFIRLPRTFTCDHLKVVPVAVLLCLYVGAYASVVSYVAFVLSSFVLQLSFFGASLGMCFVIVAFRGYPLIFSMKSFVEFRLFSCSFTVLFEGHVIMVFCLSLKVFGAWYWFDCISSWVDLFIVYTNFSYCKYFDQLYLDYE